jgi:hypothetical protein
MRGAVVVSWFVVISGCSAGTEKGAGTPIADSGTSTPDGQPTDPGAGPRPSPGTPPKAATGIFTITNFAGAEGSKFEISGRFQTPALNLGSTAARSFLENYEVVPLGTCKDLGRGPQTVTSDQPTLLDGGAVTLKPPNGASIAVPKQALATFVFYTTTIPNESFAPNAKFELQGGGGQVEPFDGSFWSPTKPEVTAPRPNGKVLPIKRNVPLPITWTTTGDGAPIVIFLSQKDRTITCRAEDTGAFTIPTSALSGFSPTDRFGNNSRKDQLTVEKATWYALGKDDGSGVIVSFEAGTEFEVSFE